MTPDQVNPVDPQTQPELVNVPASGEEKLAKIKEEALWLMNTGLEPTSAIKQAANSNGVSFGDEMGDVVTRVLAMLEVPGSDGSGPESSIGVDRSK